MARMSVTIHAVRAAVRRMGLSGHALCVHSSLRSFGWVEGGAAAIVEGLLAEGCTLLAPTFSYVFAVPPPDQRPARDGWDYDRFPGPASGIGCIYTPAIQEIDTDMGALPGTVLRQPGHIRGNHPLNSFTATGPLAHDLVAEQAPLNVYALLRKLAEAGGWVVLMGVGLDKLTLIHLAEQQAGRRLFRRWANGPDGHSIAVEVGGCSAGFDKLAPTFAPFARRTTVGRSRWLILPVQPALKASAHAIRVNPLVTHRGRAACERCNDAVAGGPIDA